MVIPTKGVQSRRFVRGGINVATFGCVDAFGAPGQDGLEGYSARMRTGSVGSGELGSVASPHESNPSLAIAVGIGDQSAAVVLVSSANWVR